MAPTVGRTVTFAAAAPLRIRDFRVLWLATIVSSVGTFLATVASSWLMLELTRSATWVSLQIASSTLPLLAVAIPAGALADLVDRRRLLVASQATMAVAALGMAGLWAAGAITPGRLLALGVLQGFGLSFGHPAWQALVPDLVPRETVAGAVALNSAAFNVARAVGPALGGVLVATVGPGWGFGLNAVSYLGVMAAVLSFKGGTWHHDDEGSFRTAVAAGLRYARFTPSLGWLLLVATGFALTSANVQALLPNLTDEVLGGEAVTYGVLLGAMGAGALVSAATRPAVAARLGRRMVPVGIAVFGVSGIVVGTSRTVAQAVVGMACAGLAWVWTLATLNATTQLLAPAWVRGRVMSLYTMAFLGMTPLGAVAAGALADAVGVPAAMVASSAGALVLAVAAARLPLPVLGEVATPEPVALEGLPPHAAEVEGGPVLVLTTWVIDADDLAAYLEAMDALRVVRLRTGAQRWRLYRDVEDPHRMTELVVLRSWEQHLRQHRRLDRDAVAALAHARTFDRAGGPVTAHLAAVDVEQRPGWEQLAAVHRAQHALDGSVPLPAEGRSRGAG